MDVSATITSLFNSLSQLEPPGSKNNERTSVIPERKPNILTQLTQFSASIAKHVLLTFHFLFPHDLLPALDLLDRGLINCFVYPADSHSSDRYHNLESSTPASPWPPTKEVFFIQSASAVTDRPASHQTGSASITADYTTTSTTTSGTGRYRNALRPKPTDTFYEVHLDSWNCSCAAFAFNALNLLSLPESEVGDTDPRAADLLSSTTDPSPNPSSERVSSPPFRFGGTLTQPQSPAPVCKHILAACVARSLPSWAWSAVEARSGEPWRREAKGGEEEMAGWGGGWGDR